VAKRGGPHRRTSAKRHKRTLERFPKADPRGGRSRPKADVRDAARGLAGWCQQGRVCNPERITTLTSCRLPISRASPMRRDGFTHS
jgi:hypothetical protein